MAKIQEYSAPLNIGVRPDERATSSRDMAARRISSQYAEGSRSIARLGQEIGSTVSQVGRAYVEWQEHREVSRGTSAFSQLSLNLTNAWNKLVQESDPNDPAVAGRFNDEVVGPAMEKFKESFITRAGQQWAESRVERLRTHMAEKAIADMSSLAGHAAVVNAQQTVNTLGAMVAQSPDKHTLDMALQMHRENAEILASSPNLKGTAGAKVKMELTQKGQEAIVKAAVMSAIAKNPEAGMALANDPAYAKFIQPAEIRQFEREQRVQDRLAKAEAREAARYAKEERQARSDETVVAVRKSWDVDNPGVKPISREQLNRLVEDGELTRRDFEHLVDKLERMGREETPARISQRNYPALLERIRNGEIKSLDPIWQAEIKGEISARDADRLQKIWSERRTPEGDQLQKTIGEFLKAYKPQIDKTILGSTLDPTGAENFYKFATMAERKVEEYRKAGKNPYDLFDPTKPDYLGDPKTILQFISPLDARVRAIGQKARGTGTTPRPPLSSFDGN